MSTLEHYREHATTLLKQGVPLAAYDAVLEGLRQFPRDARLRQLLALSLARTGASRQANQQLQILVEEGHTDEETVGMLARTHKDLWAQAETPEERQTQLDRAFHWYLEAHSASQGYWSGINAATMALLLGRREESERLASHVRDHCLELWNQDHTRPDAYWVLATLGEAALLLRDVRAAEAWYRRAVALGSHGVADLVSTRRNARLILQHAQADAAPIERCFQIPRVAVFSGHLIDRPDRRAPRFPPQLEGDVRRALLERLARRGIGFGYASAGNGGDILFLECLAELGAELHIVLPYNRDQFEEDSVAFVPGGDWSTRYRTLLQRATEVITASEQRMRGGAMSYEYGFRLLDGTAAVRSAELETELVCVALWDGKPGDGPGGTASSIAHWREAGRTIEIIDLLALHERLPPDLRTPAAAVEETAAPVSAPGFEAQLVGLLFADVAGFSKLTEDEIPRFVEHYLRLVADVLARSPQQPLLSNTWGDGLYLVFADVRETGRFALELSEALNATDWSMYGLPRSLSMRIAVHAGPAYSCLDPVTGRANYLGAHVALAARIEPITPPGEVYGSGAFAALAKSSRVQEFTCAYVGRTPLAKGFGTFPMYVLHPRR